MSVRWVALLVIGACGAPSSVKPAPAPAAAAPPVAPYTPPGPVAPPAFHVECHAFTAKPAPSGSGRRKYYDFSAIEILPVRRGPRVAERPHHGMGRSTRDLRLALAGRAPEVTDCWKVAASRGASETALSVKLTVDPLGGTRGVAVTGDRAADDALAACVTRALAGLVVPGASTRAARVTATLAMKHADQPPWSAPWPAHAVSRPLDERTGTQCTPVLDDGVVSEVRLPAALAVTDHDVSRNPPRLVAPSLKIGCAMTIVDADKRAVRTALMSNLGAYQACYADARERDPALGGEVKLQLGFSRNGTALGARFVEGAGDDQLHACLVAALQEIWVAPGPPEDGALQVTVPLALAPPPSPPGDDTEARLAAGDPEGAIAAFAREARTARSPRARCAIRAGVLRAVARSSPWLDDERTRLAIADLASAAGELPMPIARACVEPVVPILTELVHARGAPRGSWRLAAPDLARYTAALPLAPYLDDGVIIRWYHATALLATPRFAQAIAILEKLAWDPQVGGRVAEDLRARSERTEWLADTCVD